MTIDNKQVVALNYILHTDGENNEKVLVEKSDVDNPLTFLYGVGMMIPKFEENIHHELSTFKKVDKKWYYVSGKFLD